MQGVLSHLACEIQDFESDRPYSTALVDAPWYPAELLEWTCTAADTVGIGGNIFVSVWPETTRPGADTELQGALNLFSAWGQITRNVLPLKYETPRFEKVATAISENGPLAQSPRHGELIRIHVCKVPKRSKPRLESQGWLRFIFDQYQIALNLEASSGTPQLSRVPGARGWIWPFVSARAPGRTAIDLWSSEGEVAVVRSPLTVAAALRAVAKAHNDTEFKEALKLLPELLSWQIPHPPYQKVAEWLHR